MIRITLLYDSYNLPFSRLEQACQLMHCVNYTLQLSGDDGHPFLRSFCIELFRGILQKIRSYVNHEGTLDAPEEIAESGHTELTEINAK